MAKRAIDTFTTWVGGDGKRRYHKDEIVPAKVAKDVPELVYDDGAKTTGKTTG